MDRVPIPVVVAALRNHRRVFLVQRERGRPLAGEWEFPGGKVEIGESPMAALRRELREELELTVGRVAVFGAYSHVYEFPDAPVHYVLLAYTAPVRDGPWSRHGRWMDRETLGRSRIIAGSKPIVSDLLARAFVT